MKILEKLDHQLNRHRGKLLALSTMVIAWRNWQLWQRDENLVSKGRVHTIPATIFTHSPKVSFLVAAWNEATIIGKCLASLVELKYPDLEIIVCAGGLDGSLEIAQRYAGNNVLVLEQVKGWGKQRALAECFSHSSGSIIYLTDADCIINQAAFERVLDPLLNEGELVTTGSRCPLSDQMGNKFVLYQWMTTFYIQKHWGEYSDGISGANAALRREVVDVIGGFKTRAPTGTDYILGQQIQETGIKIRLVADSMIQTFYEESLFPYFRQQRRWLLNLLILGWRFKRPEHYKSALRSIVAGNLIFGLLFGISINLICGNKLKVLGYCLYLYLFFQIYSLLTKLRCQKFLQANYGDEMPLKLGLPRLILYQNFDFLVWFAGWWEIILNSGKWSW